MEICELNFTCKADKVQEIISDKIKKPQHLINRKNFRKSIFVE